MNSRNTRTAERCQDSACGRIPRIHSKTSTSIRWRHRAVQPWAHLVRI